MRKQVNHKVLSLLLFLGVTFLFVRCTPSDNSSSAPSWKGIMLGQTTSIEVIQKLGKPEDITTGESDIIGTELTVYQYPAEYENYPNYVAIDNQCDCVISILSDVLSRDPDKVVQLQDVFDKYGKPEAVTQSTYHSRVDAFIYATQGIVAVASENLSPDTATVYAIFYYEPMRLDEFMETWAKDWNRDVPYWSEYKYTDPD